MASLLETLTEQADTSAELTIGAGETGVRFFVKDVKDMSVKIEVQPTGVGEWYPFQAYPRDDIPELRAQPLLLTGDKVRMHGHVIGSRRVNGTATVYLQTTS